MDFNRACELVNEIYNDSRVQKKIKFSAATWMGRLINVGYSIDDIFRTINDPSISTESVINNINIRADIKKQLYYQQLMKI